MRLRDLLPGQCFAFPYSDVKCIYRGRDKYITLCSDHQVTASGNPEVVKVSGRGDAWIALQQSRWAGFTNPVDLVDMLPPSWSDRKRRLTALGVVRRLRDVSTPDIRRSVAVVEKMADDMVPEQTLKKNRAMYAAPAHNRLVSLVWYIHAQAFMRVALGHSIGMDFIFHIIHAAALWRTYHPHSAGSNLNQNEIYQQELAAGCVIIRDIQGDPYCEASPLPAILLQNRDVQHLATTIYRDWRFSDLPVLADALEDAGCDQHDILTHLRAPLLHTRGCWALDTILGKS